MSSLLLLSAAFAMLMATSAYALLRMSQREAAVDARLRLMQEQGGRGAIKRTARRQTPQEPAGRIVLRIIGAVGGGVLRSGVISPSTLAALQQTLVASGLRSANAVPLFVGSKIVLLSTLCIICAFVAASLAPGTIFVYVGPAIGIAAGLVLPDAVIRRIRGSYIQRVEQGVPDALDMMVICARAGLPLEPALARVADEIQHARLEIARELSQTVAEMRVVADNRAALLNLGVRTDLECLKRLTTTLVQTMEYGTPLVDALRSLSTEMRQDMLTRAEERAARLPVLLTIPMILFILPCQFIVAGGPAALQISKAFSH